MPLSLKQKLQFLLSDSSSSETLLSKRLLSPEELRRQLERLLLEEMATDEEIFDWVEVCSPPVTCFNKIDGQHIKKIGVFVYCAVFQANLDESQMSSSPFLRALMTAVCKAAVKGELLRSNPLQFS